MSRCAVPENDDERHEYGPSQPRLKKQLSAVLPAHGGMLQTVPYPLGLYIFADYAWHKWYSQADVFLRRHPKARIKCLGAGGAAARRHSSGATPAEKKRHVADAVAFDARELGGRYRALRERVPCRSRYMPHQ